MTDDFPTIDFPAEIVDMKYPLTHFQEALSGRGAVQIVALGSSSTAGLYNVVSYPARLELYLRAHYKDHDPHQNIRIDVFNRGKGGEEAPEELDRFQTDIFQDNPALVIWQVGTNAVFHNDQYDVDVVAAKIEEGLGRLCGHNFDVLLIDPQYTTKMLWDDRAELSDRMVRLIRAAADKAEVNLFQRWALMRHWHVHNKVPLELMVDKADHDMLLHQSDWSTMQVARALTSAILKKAGATKKCDCLITTGDNAPAAPLAPPGQS
ncbi:SGNH/GDSL hydrolase family protein [Bradyrhizobium liaoningense]|uniref:SGNH/GDSL hydrolase family protein n=1 Tax=Bradyrhizobium liaoningense TaxID=43992 RepID=UPI001BA7C69B|nr:SGNH/GDSL hydrolase family protein [Bradyrhizobium liaoningense]MBR0715901.1 SGNH/GDSL hydrolase family protein [Bradyrhizobium liaoningense]